jgi:hypothetical protein
VWQVAGVDIPAGCPAALTDFWRTDSLRSFLPSKALLATSSRQAYRFPIDFSRQSAPYVAGKSPFARLRPMTGRSS